MSYVTDTLTGDEQVLYEGQRSPWFYWPLLLPAGLWTLLFIVFWVYSLGIPETFETFFYSFLFILVRDVPDVAIVAAPCVIWAVIGCRTTEFAITSKRVVAKFGIIFRNTYELNLEQVENAQITQGVVGRMFNYGTVRIGSAGGATPIRGVINPLQFRKEIMRLQEEVKGATE